MNDTPAQDETAGSAQNETAGSAQPKTTGMDGFFDGIRRTGITRSEDRWIAGVCGGLARRMNVDPLIVRGLFGVSVLFGGLGLVLYGIGWLLLPEERDGRIHLQQLLRGDFDAAVIGAFGLILIGFAFPDRWSPFMWWWAGESGWWRGLVALIAIAVIIGVIASAASTSSSGTQSSAPRTSEGSTMNSSNQYAASGQTTTGQATTGQTTTGQYGSSGQYGTSGQTATGQTATTTRSTTKGPGATAVGVVFALSLLTLAALLYAERLGYFDGSVLLTAGAVTVILCGLGIVVAGLQGHSSGGLGVLAIVSLVVLLPLSIIDGADWNISTVGVGNVSRTPTTVEEAEDGLSLGAGEVAMDLTEVPLEGDAITVPIHMGTGEVRVIMPDDGAYTARVRVMAGETHWPDSSVTSGLGTTWQEFESEAVRDGAEPDMALRITVGAGTVTVVEASR